MKIAYFSSNPYRELPKDFRQQYHSIWVDPPNTVLCDSNRVADFYDWTLDEYTYAAHLGFDALLVNEHHQNTFGMFNAPNMWAAMLADRTRELGTALLVAGDTLPTYGNHARVAEELAVLDVISRGRVAATLPVGSVMDTVFNNGFTPSKVRQYYEEGRQYVVESWTRPGPFIFNGRFTKRRYVNQWPLPYQKPHPPIWVGGLRSPETWEMAVREDYTFSCLSVTGKALAGDVFKQYWDLLSRTEGRDDNPYRAGCFQFIAVADSDAEAERLYGAEALDFFNSFAHIYEAFRDSPGYVTKRSRIAQIASGAEISKLVARGSSALPGVESERTWGDLLRAGAVIAGSPDSVAEQLIDLIKEFRFGHLLVGFQIVPNTELVKHNIKLFAEHVLPRLRPLWDDEGWDDPWWPSGAKVPPLLTDNLSVNVAQ